MKKDVITRIIERKIKIKEDVPRDYIGASIIGHECWKKIWLDYRGVKGLPLPPRTKRIFEIGHALEALVLKWLSESGFKIDSQGMELVDKDKPYFKGHCDGLIIDNDIVGKAFLEIKTAKSSSYSKFFKHGLRRWNPAYYAQCQSYMGMSDIKKCYILVLNKDNADFSDELVEFDENYYQHLCFKAEIIHDSEIEPPQIDDSPVWHECKMCKFHKVCHG